MDASATTAVMADGNSKLVKVGTLEPAGGRAQAWYTAVLCLSRNRLLLIDSHDDSYNVLLYDCGTGNLIAISERLRSRPWDVCLLDGDESEIAVSLGDGNVQIMSIESTGSSIIIKPVKTLATKLEECYGMRASISQGNLVLSGLYQQMFCWCLLSVLEGEISTIQKICEYKGFGGFLSTSKDQFNVYISCYAGLSTGVYGYQTQSGKHKFTYTHRDLANPRGLCVDSKGYIYVSNCGYPACIHQLSQEGEPVMVFKEGISPFPLAIYLEENQDELMVTSFKSNEISRFRIECGEKQDNAAIPAEILRMDDRSIQLFKAALKDGEVRVYNIRVMVVGHLGVGKTTLIKRLLGEEVNITDRRSTEGIIVHVHCCKISRDTMKWTSNEGDLEQNLRLQRLARVLNDKLQKRNSTDKIEEQVAVTLPDEITYEKEKEPRWQDTGQGIPSSSASDKFPSIQTKDQINVEDPESAKSEVDDDAAVEILKLLRDKADKLKHETDENVPLTMADFAGQYTFYTTHQTFLTERAIYLLVSDISQQVTDLVKDEYYFDMEGIKLCKVYELVEIWLNSIHSCAPYPEADTPPVILVGTHVDKIQQDSRKEVCEKYFRNIRCEYLGVKPTIVHLADEDFAIDNTVIDPKLDKLKQKIVQLASKQPYWGEVIPARWLPLEERLMSLKDAGVKVIPYSLLEKMNQEGAVKIESREELDLFLRFQHDIGNILYFGTKELKEQIMLDPQWLIHALRTLITAEDFILKKIKKPTVIQKWREFKKTGKLTQELIDAIWTKENNSDFHDSKELLLLLMEKLNIIARSRSFCKAGDEVKVENCFIAPCMLSEKTPIMVISPEQHPEMESSSVLCYVFTGKFLPSPIFHRLLAACVAQWPIAKKKSENLIFCGCCVFEVDPCHKLTLHLKDYVIFARVTKTSKSNKTPSYDVCIQIMEFIDDNLSKFIGYICQNLRFEKYIQCPQSQADCLETMFPVLMLLESEELSCSSHDNEHSVVSQDLLKFWFKDKQKMDTVEQDPIYSGTSDLTTPEKCRASLRRRALPPGKKYHVFFSYSSSDIQWVKETVQILEKDHGFVCCEYDRDNAPGTPLLPFADHSIKNACRTVVVMTMEAFNSGFVLHEIQMALLQGFGERRKCVVPLLLKDCEVPGHLSVLNYIDARDPKRRDIWWPKLLMELETQICEDKVSEAVPTEDRNHATEESKISAKSKEEVEKAQSSSEEEMLPSVEIIKDPEDLEVNKQGNTISSETEMAPSVHIPEDSADTEVNKQVLPPEILRMNESSQRLYREALTAGSERVYNIRVMIIGHQGVGKTSLTRRLLGEQVIENETESTEGIDIHDMCCQIDHETREWSKMTDTQLLKDHRIADILLKHVNTASSYDTEIRSMPEAFEITPAYETSEFILLDTGMGTPVEPDTDDAQDRMATDVSILTSKTQRISLHEQNIQSSSLEKNTSMSAKGKNEHHLEKHSSNETRDNTATDATISPSKTQIHSLHGENTQAFLPEELSSYYVKDEQSHDSEIDQFIRNADSDNQSFYLDLGKEKEYQPVSSFPEEITKLVQRTKFLSSSMKTASDVTLLDAAGRCLFYTTHHAFMSWRMVYILVTNMSLSLSDTVHEHNYNTAAGGNKICTVQECLAYWFNSIHSRVFVSTDYKSHMEVKEKKQREGSESYPDNTSFCPPVILVGTHVDKIPQESLNKKKESHFQEIRSMVKDTPLRHFLIDEDFAINNLESDSTITNLKSKIFEVVQKQKYWGEEIPARWIRLERELMQLKRTEKSVIDYTDIERLNQALQMRIERPEELELFLRFEHDVGNIVFFNTKRLRQKVVLDPELVIRGLKTFIASDQFMTKHQEYSDKWFEFKKNGRLTKTFIDLLWSHHPDLHTHQEYLLNLMERLNVIARPLVEDENKEEYYWVPCMIHEKVPDHIKGLGESEDTTKTPTLCFKSTNNFIHVGVFHRLIALGLSKWPPGKEGKKHLLFSGLCVFELDKLHNLTLALNDSVIHATVIRYSKKRRVPDLSVCIKIRNYLQAVLSEIADCLCPSSEFETCIKCNESSPLTNEGLHKLSSLRKHDEMRCNSHKGVHCVDSQELLRFWESLPMSYLYKQLTLRLFNENSFPDVCCGIQSSQMAFTFLHHHSKLHAGSVSEARHSYPSEKESLDPSPTESHISAQWKHGCERSSHYFAAALLNNIVPSLGQQEKDNIMDLLIRKNTFLHVQSTKITQSDIYLSRKNITATLTDPVKLCNATDVKTEIQEDVHEIQHPGPYDLIFKFEKV